MNQVEEYRLSIEINVVAHNAAKKLDRYKLIDKISTLCAVLFFAFAWAPIASLAAHKIERALLTYVVITICVFLTVVLLYIAHICQERGQTTQEIAIGEIQELIRTNTNIMSHLTLGACFDSDKHHRTKYSLIITAEALNSVESLM